MIPVFNPCSGAAFRISTGNFAFFIKIVYRGLTQVPNVYAPNYITSLWILQFSKENTDPLVPKVLTGFPL